MSPQFSGGEAWVIGIWTSQLLQTKLLNFPSSGDNRWGVLKWFEENTENDSEAYVKMDLLDSSGNVLQADKSGAIVINSARFNRSLDLGLFSNVTSANVKIKFKLNSLTKLPIVSNIQLETALKW